jgi:dTDP-4-amino-4,6-dideoxygalactose transaminase
MATDRIPLVDLTAPQREIAAEVEAGFAAVLASTAFILGPAVKTFETDYAAFVGARHCIGVANGTDAIELGLRALGIGAGDEVIVPANSFIATALAVARAGATPVLVDCDPVYQLIAVDQIERRLSARTRAIIPVHLFGQMAPMAAIEALAKAHGLVVIEDAAQAQGATQTNERTVSRAGAVGRVAATSFYPGKNLGAYGDGGAVTTDDDALAAKIRALRSYGSEVKYHHPETGFNSRLDTLQAVVLNAKLKRLSAWNAARREAAARYQALLRSQLGSRVDVVPTVLGNEHIHHLFVVRVPNRDAVLARLNADGIGAGIHYPVPIHLQGAFAHLGHKPGDFPTAERAAAEILSLPMFPEITPDQQERVARALRAALGRG